MIGKDKKEKLILCPKCKSESIEQEDYSIDFVDETKIEVSYDVWCKDCNHSFEIADIFNYSNSISK